eukprot:EG_transcript_21262
MSWVPGVGYCPNQPWGDASESSRWRRSVTAASAGPPPPGAHGRRDGPGVSPPGGLQASYGQPNSYHPTTEWPQEAFTGYYEASSTNVAGTVVPDKPTTQDVVMVGDVASLRGVVPAVRSHGMVAVDCEGVNLSRVGQLTLLQMATPSTVYLIDVLVLKRAAFGQGMKELLEDPEFPKVMFDCRQDSDALFHQYGVRLCGVWDLQIVELSLRLCKGERAGDLGPVLYWKQGVQRLRGLMDCMRRYGAGGDRSTAWPAWRKGDLVDHKHPVHDQMRKESSFWLQRPLPPEMVRYAVGDVAGLLP